MVRMSWPSSRRCVAKEWLGVWLVARLVMAAAATAARMAPWTTVSCRWWRRTWPVSGCRSRRVAGKTQCQASVQPAFGYLRARAREDLDPPGAGLDVALVLLVDRLQLRAQWLERGSRQAAGVPVLVALALDDYELASVEVEVLHPELAALEEAQARSMEEREHQARHTPLGASEYAGDLLPGKRGGEPRRPPRPDQIVEPGQIDVEHVPVEEKQRRERLVLRAGGNGSLSDECAQELCDPRRTEPGRVNARRARSPSSTGRPAASPWAAPTSSRRR